MPELGEVAHATSILRKFLVGKVIKSVKTIVDEIVYAKPLTNEIFEKKLTGLKVSDAQRHGKYLWIRFDSSPTVALFHFGMTGWFKVKGFKSHFIVMENGGDVKANDRNKKLKQSGTTISAAEFIEDNTEPWPPKFYRFIIETEDGTEVAFTDPRRLGRIRLIDAVDDAQLMSEEPLKRNGLDFSKQEERWTYEQFKNEVIKRKVPVKSLLLDQTLFAGVGNWVADEILYQARIHPEQYSNSLDDEHLLALYDKLIEICTFVVQVEGNTAAFPDNWLMLHRWGKRRKNEKEVTNDGYTVQHVTVGGRTSSYVPELQKKIGSVKRALSQSPDSENIATVKTTKSKPRTKKAKSVKIEKIESNNNEEITAKEVKAETTRTTRSRVKRE